MPPAAAPPAPSLPPVWREVGRPWPGEDVEWTTSVAPLGRRGGALYRSLVAAEGAIAVVVELLPRPGAGAQVIHRGRCFPSRHPAETAERVRLLLAAADEAVRRAMAEVARPEAAEAERLARPSRPASHRPCGGPRDGAPGAAGDHECRLRERAYFLWERAGRPEGRAEEFWARACREEVQAAA